MKLNKIFTVNLIKVRNNKVERLANLVNGKWHYSKKNTCVIDPLTGSNILKYPTIPPINSYIDSMKSVPNYGLHNPLLNQDRYLKYGIISQRTAQSLDDKRIKNYFIELIQKVMPKSYQQAEAEVDVTKKFLYNFSGDQVRFLAQGKTTPGDHYNQQSTSYRFPYGSTALITPFNFPLEIPVLPLRVCMDPPIYCLGNRLF